MTPNHQQAADAAENELPPWIQFPCPTCHASSGAPCGHGMGSCVERVLLSKPVSPPAASPEQAAEIEDHPQAELPLPKPEARRPTVSIEDLQKFLRMYRIMAEEENGDRCRALYLAAIIEDLIGAKAELAAKDARLEELEAEFQRLRQELAKDDDTQAEMAKRIAELERRITISCGRQESFKRRAKAAESRLRAFSEALEQEMWDIDENGRVHMTSERRAFVAKLRAIVEGKVR